MSGFNINIPATFEQQVVYMECLHNHAASLGRVIYGGCRKYLRPNIGGDVDGGSNDAMLCGACYCHRNFHRKEILYNPITTAAATTIPQIHHKPDSPTTGAGPSDFPTTMTATVIARNNNNDVEEAPPVVPPPKHRRKRTKFTAEQRSRMVRFAERLGRRPQRAEDEEVDEFCKEMGICRRTLDVWLRNNRRRATQNHTVAAAATMDERI